MYKRQPQDWEGFKKLVAASNIQDKELILSVLSMYKDPEQREREIRNLSSIFDQLAEDILPKLRYSRITASIDVIAVSYTHLINTIADYVITGNVEDIVPKLIKYYKKNSK